MIKLIETSIINEAAEVSDICLQAAEELFDIDNRFYMEQIKQGVYRYYYGQKSILTVDTYKNASSGDGAVTITDYQGHREMFDLSDIDGIHDYIIERAQLIV